MPAIPGAAKRKRKKIDTTQRYVFGLAAIALTVFSLHAAESVLLPLALAVLGAFILSPIVGLAERVGLSRVPAVLLSVLVTGAAVTGIALMVGSQLTVLIQDLPNHKQEIEGKIERIRGSGGAFSRVATMVQEISHGPLGKEGEAAATEPVTVVRMDEGSPLKQALGPVLLVLEPIATGALVIILMIFVLMGREDLRSRLLGILGRVRLIAAVRVLEESSRRTGLYLLLQLLMNTAVGAVFAIGLAIIGVQYALLWGVLTALLRFVPYVGSWIALLLPLTLSFATTPGWDQPLLILGFFAVVDLIVANAIEPLVFGHHTGVAPIALLVAAAFWTWVWGPIGLLVSTPLTVCLVVLGQHVPRLRTLSLLLGDRPALAPHLEYYQRVLAGGSSVGGASMVAEQAGENGAQQAFEDILIPALVLARADRAAGALAVDEEQRISQSVRDAIGPMMAMDRGVPTVADKPLVILAVPAHHEMEEMPLQMTAAVLEREGHQVEVLTSRLLPAAVVQRVAEVGAAAVLISVIPPGGLPQASYLCQLLRKHYPNLTIIVARWGGKAKYDTTLVKLRKAGASYLTTSLAQTCTQARAAQPMPVRQGGNADVVAGGVVVGNVHGNVRDNVHGNVHDNVHGDVNDIGDSHALDDVQPHPTGA